jgi:diguanylate cyclase (GGDEF)-like protein/PAS domain S-box-containing protein
MSQQLRPERLLAAILETTDEAVVGVGLDGSIVIWSRGAERLYGYAAGEIRGETLLRLLPIQEVAPFEEMLEKAGQGQCQCGEVVERLHREGARLRVKVRRAPILDEAGGIAGVLEAGRLLEWSRHEVAPNAQLRMVAEQMPGLVWITDRNLRITANWGAGLPGTKIRPGVLEGKSVGEFLQAAEQYASPLVEHYDALRGRASQFEHTREQRTLEIRLAPLRSGTGEITGCLGAATDITERKKTEEQVRHEATHDGLTGLANYREFVNTLEREVRRAERSHLRFTLLLIDVDDLKAINDRKGHLAGNQALKRVAGALKDQCRATDLAARYGGDEFGVVLIDSDAGMAEGVVERIETSLCKDTHEPKVSVSIGIGVFPENGRTTQELLEAADRQLYQQKKCARARRSVASD